MPIVSKASFKNSRINPRSATLTSNVSKLTVDTNSPNTLVAALNLNRTYITLRNENSPTGDNIRYDYFDNLNMLTEGFLLKASEAVDLESTEPIYARAVANNVTLSTDEGSG